MRYKNLFLDETGTVVKGCLGNPKKLVIPEGIKTIDCDAFCDNNELEQIWLPKSLKTIK